MICKIIENEDMPVDQYGVRADVMVDPASVPSRMNVGQWEIHALSRVAFFVQRYMRDALNQGDFSRAESLLLEFYGDVNPLYRELVLKTKNTPEKMRAHVLDAINDCIRVFTPSSLNTISPELITMLEEKWKAEITPIKYNIRDPITGKLLRTHTSRRPMCIAKKYMVLLCKIPDPASPGVAKLNQYNTPMKAPPKDKNDSPVRESPIKEGEDEGRIMMMDLVDAEAYMRLTCLQGNSKPGVDKAIESLLHMKKPTQLEQVDITNKQLVQSNTILQLFYHMFATCGIDMKHVDVEEE